MGNWLQSPMFDCRITKRRRLRPEVEVCVLQYSISATCLVLSNYAHVDLLHTNLIKFVSFSLRCSVSDVIFVQIVNNMSP